MSSIELHHKVKIYTRRSALTAEVSELQSKGSPVNITLNIDVTGKADSSQHFNWDDKITIQLSLTELPELCALMMGYLDQVEFKRQTKGLIFERQERTIFVKASGLSDSKHLFFVIPLTTAQIFQINVIILELLKQQNHTDEVAVIIASLRLFAKK